MANLFDLTFESGALPTGVSLVTSGGSTGAFTSGGLIPSSTKFYRITQASGGDSYLRLLTGTISGVGQQLELGLGFTMRVNSIAGTGSNQTRIASCFAGASGGQFTWDLYCVPGTSTSTWFVTMATTGGNTIYTVPSTINLSDGSPHTFFFGYLYSATAGAGQYACYVDGIPVAGGIYNNSTLAYGTGIYIFQLGPYQGFTGSTCSVDFDCVYITGGLVPSTSIEQSSVISGYTGTVAATANTVALSSTLAGSAVWALRDATAFSISSGTVTLKQACGGVFDAGDGDNWITGEFLPRVLTVTPAALSGSGPYTSALTVTSSDGVTSYTDILPSAVPYSAGGFGWTSGVTGTTTPYTLTLPASALVGGVWQGLINSKFYTLSSSAATPLTVAVSPSTPTISGGGTQTFTAAVTGASVPSQSVLWSCVLGTITSGGVYTALTATNVAQTDTVTATSALDGTTTGTSTVTIPAATVSVSPGTATVAGSATQQFTSSTTGGLTNTVTWTASAGSITTGGLFTAPAATGSVQTITVTATSTIYGTIYGTATVTVPASSGLTLRHTMGLGIYSTAPLSLL